MDQINAILVTEMAGSTAAADGKHIILSFKLADDGIVSLALTADMAINLMSLNAAAVGQAARNRSADPNQKYVFPVEWWEVGSNDADGSIMMSYKMPGGLEMTFRLFPDGARHMHEVLGAVLGLGGTTPPLGTRAN